MPMQMSRVQAPHWRLLHKVRELTEFRRNVTKCPFDRSNIFLVNILQTQLSFKFPLTKFPLTMFPLGSFNEVSFTRFNCVLLNSCAMAEVLRGTLRLASAVALDGDG